jgi:hypothetical protein
MGHGGKRAGAGRKRKIVNEAERLLIVGQRCNVKWLEEAERQADQRLEERPQQHRARAVFKQLDQKYRRFHGAPPAWELQKLFSEVEKMEPHYRNIRPKGCRDAIISMVAKETGYPKRMVQRCWVEYRAWLRQIWPDMKI